MNPKDVVDKDMVVGQGAHSLVVENIVEVANSSLENGAHAHQARLKGDQKDRVPEVAPSALLEHPLQGEDLGMFERIPSLLDLVGGKDESPIVGDDGGDRNLSASEGLLALPIEPV